MNISPDSIQLGGFLINILMELVAIMASIISYAIYADSSSSDVIAYIEQGKYSRVIINLVIKNIGRGAAINIFLRNKLINFLGQENEKIDHGLLSRGIPYLVPKAERVIVLGAYHYLHGCFKSNSIKVDVIYNRARNILFSRGD